MEKETIHFSGLHMGGHFEEVKLSGEMQKRSCRSDANLKYSQRANLEEVSSVTERLGL
jgi:hypothetical protein